MTTSPYRILHVAIRIACMLVVQKETLTSFLSLQMSPYMHADVVQDTVVTLLRLYTPIKTEDDDDDTE